jgi:hypothetical protein
MTRLLRNEVDLIPLMQPDKDLAVQRYYERHSQKVLAWRNRSILRRVVDVLTGANPPKFIPFED